MPDHCYDEYFIVGRSPQEIRDVWEWSKHKCTATGWMKDTFAMGVYAALDYLLNEGTTPPQIFKGELSLKNVMAESTGPDKDTARCACCPERLDRVGTENRAAMLLFKEEKKNGEYLFPTFGGLNAYIKLSEAQKEKDLNVSSGGNISDAQSID